MRRRVKSRTLAVTVFLLLVGPLVAGVADDLNRQGYVRYQKKEFGPALELFRKAVQADANHLYANYNLACALAILLEKEYCEYLQCVDELFTHLERAFRIRPAQRRHAAADPDLFHCRKYLRYYRLMGYSWTNPVHLRTILTRTVWAVPGPGAINPIAEILFVPDGTFTAGEGWEEQKDGKYGRNTTRGRWQITVEQGKTWLIIDVPGRPRYRALWKPWEGFRIVPEGYEFSNFLGDCSA